jgi:nitrogen fixation protein FixH
MSDASEARPSDRYLPYLFFVFFGVVFFANGMLVYAAMSSWTGLNGEKHYIRGLAHNRTLEAVAAQRARGWTGSLALEPGADDDSVLRFRLTDKAEVGVVGASVTARFMRPTHVGNDFTVRLQDLGGGRYVARAEVPLAGQWDVDVVAEHSKGRFQVTHRVQVP